MPTEQLNETIIFKGFKMSKNDKEKQGAAPDETVDQFKKDFKNKTNTAVEKWPSQDFGPAIDEVGNFVTDTLKKLVQGKSYAPILDFIIDFIGKGAEGLLKLGTEKLQEFLAKKVHKDIKEDPKLAEFTSEKDKAKIAELDNKLNPKEKDKDKSVASHDTKAIADSMKNTLQHPRPQTISSAPANKVVVPHVDKSTGHGGR